MTGEENLCSLIGQAGDETQRRLMAEKSAAERIVSLQRLYDFPHHNAMHAVSSMLHCECAKYNVHGLCGPIQTGGHGKRCSGSIECSAPIPCSVSLFAQRTLCLRLHAVSDGRTVLLFGIVWSILSPTRPPFCRICSTHHCGNCQLPTLRCLQWSRWIPIPHLRCVHAL